MIPEIKYLPINWVDGMKISKTHFVNFENAVIDSTRDVAALGLTDFNFGLLPLGFSVSDSHSLDVNSERVEVYHCRAVCRNGARIEIINHNLDELKISMLDLMGGQALPQSSEWFVVIMVNPFQRNPIGDPDPTESPTRQPNTIPTYRVALIPVEQINTVDFAGSAIPIAKIKGGIQGLQRVDNYIPPCMRVDSNKELINVYRKFKSKITGIEEHILPIIRKINEKRRRNQSKPLAEDIFLVCQKLVETSSGSFDDFRMIYQQRPPIYMIAYFVKIARSIHTTMRFLSNKDSMLEYFRQYTNLQYGNFNEVINGLINMNYNHFDIRESIDKIDNFLNLIENLFEQLKGLSYEQIAEYDPVRGTVYNRGNTTTRTTRTTTSAPPPPPRKKSGGSIVIRQGGAKGKGDTPPEGGGGWDIE